MLRIKGPLSERQSGPVEQKGTLWVLQTFKLVSGTAQRHRIAPKLPQNQIRLAQQKGTGGCSSLELRVACRNC